MQLYLNYKLKSVAHLPWRQMSYKFLNTIIDDLFAFVIKVCPLCGLPGLKTNRNQASSQLLAVGLTADASHGASVECWVG